MWLFSWVWRTFYSRCFTPICGLIFFVLGLTMYLSFSCIAHKHPLHPIYMSIFLMYPFKHERLSTYFSFHIFSLPLLLSLWCLTFYCAFNLSSLLKTYTVVYIQFSCQVQDETVIGLIFLLSLCVSLITQHCCVCQCVLSRATCSSLCLCPWCWTLLLLCWWIFSNNLHVAYLFLFFVLFKNIYLLCYVLHCNFPYIQTYVFSIFS